MYATLGFVVLMLGVAGYVVPGLPGTPFLLVAAWLFSMSSEGLYRWMTTNRWFGETVADYRAGLGISRKTKVVALSSMAIVVPVSVAVGTPDWRLRVVVVTLAIVGAIFILTRPTRELVAETS